MGIIKSKVLYQACATDDPIPLVRITAEPSVGFSLRILHCGSLTAELQRERFRSERSAVKISLKVPQ